MKSSEFINETTSSGGIAVVVGGGPTISRYGNPSIYQKTEKKKKVKEDDKYANSIKRD